MYHHKLLETCNNARGVLLKEPPPRKKVHFLVLLHYYYCCCYLQRPILVVSMRTSNYSLLLRARTV